jgi:cyclophilin family peptidyl-prolyl cis-trans isomerase
MRRLLAVLILALALPACARYSANDPLLRKEADKLTVAEMQRMAAVIVTPYGKIVIELHPEWAPIATRNFIKLTQAGYYDGLTICEIRPTVWIRGGAPLADECKGSPGYFVPLEKPSAPVQRGMFGLYHYDMQPKEGTSQFFIMLNNAPTMDGGYTIFGKVVEGMPAVDRIGKMPSTPRDSVPSPFKPLANIVIEDLHLEVKK